MKIGIICHDAFPIAQPFQGGLEMITSLLVRELVRRGNEVTSLCLEGSDLAGRMFYYDRLTPNDSSLDKELVGLAEFSRSLNKFLQFDFDVIHNHSLHYQSIILGNLFHKPFVTTFHTPTFPYLKVGIEAISSNIDQIFIGVSRSLSKLYEHYLPEVSTIYNGIDISQWKTNFDEVQDYYSWSGRICKEKGLAPIMKLCIDENINLKIAGPVSDPEYFEKEVKPLLNYENFDYVGHLEQKELNEHIKNSKAFIFSSLWDEPYGLVLAEALACGVPIIANAVGAAPEIIGNDSGCLFTIDRSSTFAYGLNIVEKISRRNCRQRAEKFCSHVDMVDKYEQLYERLSGNDLKTAI